MQVAVAESSFEIDQHAGARSAVSVKHISRVWRTMTGWSARLCPAPLVCRSRENFCAIMPDNDVRRRGLGQHPEGVAETGGALLLLFPATTTAIIAGALREESIETMSRLQRVGR